MTKFTFATRDEGFDNHIDKSIRGYQCLWDDVVNMSQYFVEDNTNVADIGCSTGKLLNAMIEQNTFAPNAHYVGIEIEEDFHEDLLRQTKFTVWPDDVRKWEFNEKEYSLITSIFTLQFMPKRDRQDIINSIHGGLQSGGAFIFAEKTYATDYFINEMRTFIFYDHKRKHFDDTDILDKEVQLRHMMKPNTRTELYNMCKKAGFERIETFWQNHAFMGFICIK